jgi:regulator of extracellular matrix RemA (YlzA/DUF370 family)
MTEKFRNVGLVRGLKAFRSVRRRFVMMISVGHGNYVRGELVASVLRPDSAAGKRARRGAAEDGVLIDTTAGHRIGSVVALTSGQVVVTTLKPEVVLGRLQSKKD